MLWYGFVAQIRKPLISNLKNSDAENAILDIINNLPAICVTKPIHVQKGLLHAHRILFNEYSPPDSRGRIAQCNITLKDMKQITDPSVR